jgi:hypothetical protein
MVSDALSLYIFGALLENEAVDEVEETSLRVELYKV